MSSIDNISDKRKYDYVVDAGILYLKYQVQPNGQYDLGYTPVKVLGILDDPGSNAIVLEILDGRLVGTGEQILIYAENREQLAEHGFRDLKPEAASRYFKEYQFRNNLDDRLKPIHENEEGIDYLDDVNER
ncbi:MAG: hypothetical protein HZA95_00930 [Candidatus Vogelbacteria bacterium]|nr:hypothetical protein [Candidatus Vogelbacteria bacterium]